MAQIDATLSPDSDISKRLTKGMNESNNPIGGFALDANALRAPDYFLYIHSISPKGFEVRLPPIMPKVNIPACKKGERVNTPIKIPNIVNQAWEDATSGELRICGTPGERVCMNIINPANMGTDQDVEIDVQYQQFHVGGDLSVYGVWYSRNEVPTDEEMVKPRAKMEKYYRKMLGVGDELHRTGKQSQIPEDSFIAASYFSYRSGWNTVVEVPEACPICGGPMRKGVAIHGGADGCNGVVDWEKAISSGLKTEKDRPKAPREI